MKSCQLHIGRTITFYKLSRDPNLDDLMFSSQLTDCQLLTWNPASECRCKVGWWLPCTGGTLSSLFPTFDGCLSYCIVIPLAGNHWRPAELQKAFPPGAEGERRSKELLQSCGLTVWSGACVGKFYVGQNYAKTVNTQAPQRKFFCLMVNRSAIIYVGCSQFCFALKTKLKPIKRTMQPS